MWLERLRLYNWRNFRDEVITFKKGVNALCGDNGAGKTNCLEAIAFLSRGCSFRHASLDEMRRTESERLILEIIFRDGGVEHKLALLCDGGALNVRFNGQKIKQWRGLISTVLWLPQDAEIVRGSPLARRRFLDDHLHQCDPLYTHHFVRFYRFLKQRNHLLKQKKIGELKVWNESLASAGGYICAARSELIEHLKQLLAQFFRDIHKDEPINLRYRPALSSSIYSEKTEAPPQSKKEFAVFILSSLNKRVSEELNQGTTLYGPHRDDFEVIWNQNRARHYISNGQAKLCSAGFRVAEWRRLKALGQKPVLLIDEFGSGLDRSHQRGIWNAFEPATQIIAACSTLQKKALQTMLNVEFQSTRVVEGIFYNETAQ